MVKKKEIDTGNLPFEDAMQKLESIVAQLEAGELSLSQSLESFEDGMKLAKACEIQLNEATGRVEKIMKDFAGKEKLILVSETDLDKDEDSQDESI